MTTNPIITLDTDWAPDFVIEYIVKILSANNVKATWFITHESPFLKELKNNSLFELGIHPNFEPNSTQGNNPESILQNLKKILPHAKSIRTHGLFQSTNLLLKFQNFGIQNDVSMLLFKTKNLSPHYSKLLNLFRFPFFWEDDEEMAFDSNWLINMVNFKIPGMKIFNFHPIHIYLNSNKITNYNSMKKEIGLQNLNEENIEKFKNKNNPGTKTFFEEIISSLKGKETFQIQDLRKTFEDFFK